MHDAWIGDLSPRTVSVTVRGGGRYTDRGWHRFYVFGLGDDARLVSSARRGNVVTDEVHADLEAGSVIMIVAQADVKPQLTAIVLVDVGDPVLVVGHGQSRLRTTGEALVLARGNVARDIQAMWQQRAWPLKSDDQVRYARQLSAWLATDDTSQIPMPQQAFRGASVLMPDLIDAGEDDPEWVLDAGLAGAEIVIGLVGEVRRKDSSKDGR